VPGPGGIGTGTSPVAVAAEITGLHPGTAYHYRLRAANADGPIAPASETTLQTAGPRILDSWSEDVLLTEAKLRAKINPEGSATTYRVEYGETAAYGSGSGELNVASDSSAHTVAFIAEGLSPGTEYHWRVVTTNANGENEGPDHAIRTFRPFSAETDCPNQANRYGAGANLPDCRAYEMVSPVDKLNSDIVPPGDAVLSGLVTMARTQATASGDKLTYSSYRAFADAQSVGAVSQYIARRTAGGWETHSINQPGGAPLLQGVLALHAQYEIFSDDLCQAWTKNFFESPLLEGVAGLVNVYRRQDRLCGAERFEAVGPIVTPPAGSLSFYAPYVQGVSADGSHAIFTSNKKLVPEGGEGPNTFQAYESTEPGAAPRLVCILPDGEAWKSDCTVGSSASGLPGPQAVNRTGAVSEDGERIFWTNRVGGEGKVYVRIGGTETVPVSEAEEEAAGTDRSFFWGAASDGSRAILTTGGTPSTTESVAKTRLFAFDVDAEATEPIAEGVYGVVGIGEDARRVYFLSLEKLPASGQNGKGEEALAGRPNLYLYDADAGHSTFIATVASEDIPSGNIDTGTTLIDRAPATHLSRVTPDGLHLAFGSKASLTGYDNTSLTNGQPNRLAYVYDAVTGKLVCASCNPSGGRGRSETPESDNEISRRPLPIPGAFETSIQPSRMLSEDGSRLVFESANALDPRDTNNKIDVYQWEREGAGGCDAGDSRFAPSAGGCISLISSGKTSVDTEFAEATPTGSDIYFYTTSSFARQDFGLRDIYDARVGGGYPLPPEAPECVGDACQSIPPAPNDPTPASASFRGAGDPTPRRNCRASARRAVKLSRRAKRLRIAAKRSASAKRSSLLRRRSARFAKSAKRLSKSAARCRRANRRAGR
jgi:hypothetical protein